METLYYDVILREYGYLYTDDREAGIYNEGFLIIQREGERIKNIEGVLTCDYIKSERSREYVRILYYVLNYSNSKLVKQCDIFIKEDYELPINLQIEFPDIEVEIITRRKVTNLAIKEKYNERLAEFKKNNVFEKER